MKKIIAELIKKGHKKLAAVVKKVEAKGLTYNGEGKKTKFAGKITIPILGTSVERLYVDRETGAPSAAKEYALDYDKGKMRDALDRAVLKFIQKYHPDAIWSKKYAGSGDHATIGFAKSWHNQAKEDSL